MRAAFVSALVVLWLGYTVLAFRLEFFGPAGTLGAGFFPQLISMALGLAFVAEGIGVWKTDPVSRPTEVGDDMTVHPAAAGQAGALAVGLAVLIPIVGALLAMVLFLFVSLQKFYGGRATHRLIFAVVVPVAVYLLFNAWLKIQLPSGLLGTVL